MDKMYFYIGTGDVLKVREILLTLKLDLNVCRVHEDTRSLLVSFRSSLDEQKAVLKKIKDNGISYSVI